MLFDTVDQGSVFLLMCGAGAALGLWYDLVALARRALEAGPLLSLLTDAVLGLGAAALLAAALVAANYGRPRLYMLLAVALGATAYGFGASRPLRALLRRLRRAAARLGGHMQNNRIIKVIFR